MISVAIDSKHIGGVQILGAIRLDIKRGETLAVVGPSGVGKTTLLRLLAGLDTDFQGAVVVPECRAMVFQEPALLPWRTAIQNLTVTTGASDDAALAALREVGLDGYANRFPRQLSLGQQRRLSIARAFAASPELLLMDEPFVSLDAPLVLEMLELTERMLRRRSIATVFVTHDMTEATRLASRIVRLEGDPATLADISC